MLNAIASKRSVLSLIVYYWTLRNRYCGENKPGVAATASTKLVRDVLLFAINCVHNFQPSAIQTCILYANPRSNKAVHYVQMDSTHCVSMC